VSFNLAVESEQWTLSFVAGMDFISRFSDESMVDLRDEVLNIARIKRPKFLIARNRNIYTHSDINTVPGFLDDVMYNVHDIPNTNFFQQICEFRNYKKSRWTKAVTMTMYFFS
jgi:hypothetical protein